MKTPEEIKKGLICHAVQWHAGECPDHEPGCKGCPYENDYHDPDELMADALELIEELEKKVPKWISVKERLPEAGARVLVAVGAVFEAYIDDAGVWQRYYSSPMKDVLGEPTHWMPLPELPGEET